MKTKTLLLVGLAFLLLSLGLLCPHPSAAQSGTTIEVVITGPDYDPIRNVYGVAISASNSQQVMYLLVSVEDADAGTLIIHPFEVVPRFDDANRLELPGARLTPEHTYLLKIQAVDMSGNYIRRAEETYTGADPLTLASKEFVHLPPAPPKFEFTIESTTVDFAKNQWILQLKVPTDASVERYDGFLVDSLRQRVADIAPTLYPGPVLILPLPDPIAKLTEIAKFIVTLNLYARDGQQAQASYEFEVSPPPKPSIWKRIGQGLKDHPAIIWAIVLVPSVIATIAILSRRRKTTKGQTPFGSYGPVADEGFVPPAGSLTIRVVDSPGESKGRAWTITRFPCVIGRSHGCDIVLDDSMVSKRHLEISLRAGSFYLKDLGSSNGTFVGSMGQEERLSPHAAERLGEDVSVRVGGRTILELD